FRSEHPEITTNDFVIDGVVDFGVMIGFNESISLYGNTDSLIVSNEAVDYGLGITVATTTESEAADTYTGDIYIDKTVSFQIFDAVYPIGVNIDSSIATSSEITVNGKFELTATSATSYAVGVEFDSDCSGKLIVDGAFTINSEYLSWGVYIYGQIIGDVIINGTFILNALNEASGVVFYGEVKNDVTIDGTFSINSDDVAYGVQFSNEIVSSTQNINGVFDIRSTTSNTIGVLFVHTDTGSFQNINGTFSIDTSCSDATTIYALQFGGTIAGKTTINGYFAVNSLGYSGGVYFATNTTGEIDINGIFTLNAGEGDAQGVVFGGGVSDVTINGAFVLYRDSSSSYSNFGVSFGSEPESIEGTPSFYSNSIDWGEWITWGGTENWNGVECATGGETPTGDGTLALKSLYNNQNPEAYDYSIMIIENADTDIAAFNGPYKTKLNAYVLTLPDSSIGKVWLTSILNQTW
ncbi:MAG: hypothetical protein LBM72_00810, partial [Mycoplasmataceae bacterium]|nr:hypothetical protein [Mycoplasmataceae bacterium]